MTKEQFLNGTQFKIQGPTYKGASTFNYQSGSGSICKQTRSSINEKIILDDYHCNVDTIGRTSFSGFVYVIGKCVKVKYRYDQLVAFEE